MAQKQRILLAEDDENLGLLLSRFLTSKLYHVQLVRNGKLALEAYNNAVFDFCIFDVMMPLMDGFSVAKEIREINKQVPILFLTAKTMEQDKLKAFALGADDYMTKPFSPKELVARIHAVLRRSGKILGQAQICLGDLTLDTDQHRLSIGDKQLEVSPTEFRLMHFFMTHPDKVYTRTQLLDQVWGRSVYIEERTIDVHIRRLRKILEEYGRDDLVQTVRGFGYRFSIVD